MEKKAGIRDRAAGAASQLAKDAAKTSYDLFKIMIPLIVIAKVLQEIGFIDYLGAALGPVMRLVGLPGSMGVVWASAIITNVYGGVAVFAALAPAAELTAAQATIICTMMLVAHNLPVELRIAQKAGARLRAMAVLRFLGALALGALLNWFYAITGLLQGPHAPRWLPPPSDPSWRAWAAGQARNLGLIFLIILALLFLLRLLKWVGATDLFTRILEPVLTTLGMSREAAPMTIIGMTMGLAYGGGLIIREAQAGHLSRRDIFFSLSLMGLSHSLIEDTLLMAALGGHLSGTLAGRVVFSLVAVFLLAKALGRTPGHILDRFFFRAPAAGSSQP